MISEIITALVYLQIFVLESFPKSRLWWKKEDNVIPRCVGWADGTKFNKTDYDALFYSTPPLKKIMPTPTENQSLWWRSSIAFFQQLETSDNETPKPVARRKFAPRICRRFVSQSVKQEVMKHVKPEVSAPVEDENENEEEVNEEVVDEGLHGLSKSELVKKLADMERELTNYKTISTRLTAIEQLLKPQIVPTIKEKAESIGIKIGEALTCENSVIASNGVKGCETANTILFDVVVGVDYVVNKQNLNVVKKSSDVSLDLSDSVNNRNLVDVCVSVSNTFKAAYEGVMKEKHGLVEECNAGRVLGTDTNALNKRVTEPFDWDNGVVTKRVCVDKFVTTVGVHDVGVHTDHDVGVHASHVSLLS